MPLRLPPAPADLDPLVLTVAAGTVLYRVHPELRGAAGFNPGLGPPSRFAPLRDGDRVIPTLYAAGTIDAALSESVFHDTPVRGPAKRILHARLRGMVLSPLACSVDLALADLAGPGLTRLGLRRASLIDTPSSMYPATAAWGLALHDAPAGLAGLAGLAWTSRFDDRARAFILFGDRVAPSQLDLLLPRPVPLWTGVGLDLVLDLAARAGIDVVR